MDVLNELEKLKDNIESTTVVTLTARRLWAGTIQGVMDTLGEDEYEDEDEGDEDEDEDDEETTYLSAKAAWQVAHVLGIPQWKVEEDPEAAVLDLCERLSRRGK